MDKETFARHMKLAAVNFNRTLDEDLLRLYFEDLGGTTEKKFERAIRTHISTSRFFPKIPEIRKLLGDTPGVKKTKDTRREHTLHWSLADQMLLNRINGSPWLQPTTEETTLFPLEPLVDKAFEVYETFKPLATTETGEERSRRSAAFGTLNLLVVQALAEVV